MQLPRIFGTFTILVPSFGKNDQQVKTKSLYKTRLSWNKEIAYHIKLTKAPTIQDFNRDSLQKEKSLLKGQIQQETLNLPHVRCSLEHTFPISYFSL